MSIGGTYDLPLPLICVIKVRMRDFLMAILSSEWPSFIVILVMRFCNWCNLWNHLPLSFFLLLMMIFFCLTSHRETDLLDSKYLKNRKLKTTLHQTNKKSGEWLLQNFPGHFGIAFSALIVVEIYKLHFDQRIGSF